MIDAGTRKPRLISYGGAARPYIWLPDSQVPEVSRLLKEQGVRFSVGENVVSLDGGPEMAIIDLGRDADGAPIRAILDSVR